MATTHGSAQLSEVPLEPPGWWGPDSDLPSQVVSSELLPPPLFGIDGPQCRAALIYFCRSDRGAWKSFPGKRASPKLYATKVFEFYLLSTSLCRARSVSLLTVSTPSSLTSCSSLFKWAPPGGPPPLRSEHFPLGLPGVAGELWWQLWSGNEFLARSLVLFEAVVRAGGNASLENPLSSLMWKVPWLQASS